MKKLFAITALALLLSAHAFAVDSDGDGVDDSVDAFPGDPCGTTDTDGDGKPNELTCLAFYDGFDGTHIGPAWETMPIGLSTDGSALAGYVGKGLYAITGAMGWSSNCSFLRPKYTFSITLPGSATMIYYSRSGDGFGGNRGTPSAWFKNTRSLSSGTHVLEFASQDCNYYDFDEIYIRTQSTLLEWDYDDDNDGILDPDDVLPLDPAESADNDGDGIGDNADTDDDNDGVADGSDNCPLSSNPDQMNTDGDPQGNACDVDDDNDGVADTTDKFPLNPAASSDSDNDGFPGSWRPTCDATCQTNSGLTLDNCPTTSNPTQANNDGDAQGDACDTDDDNDGVLDTGDAYPFDSLQAGDIDVDGVDGFVDNCPANSNSDQLDTDGDTQGNACDTDDDNDGVADTSDKFPLNPAASSDSDNDGFPGSWRPTCDATCQANSGLTLDNCPTTANPTQANFDGDTQGDACDADDDNDGITDTYDLFPLDNTQAGDYDGDGVEGLIDNCLSTSNADQLNTDGDAQGNACDTDDDNDGVADTSDKFPLNPAASSDADNDGFPGSWRPTCDATCQANSGLMLDNCPTTANPTQANFDGDAQGDACDSTPNGDADSDAIDNLSDNCVAASNPDQLDSDNNGIGDVCEPAVASHLKSAKRGSALALGDINGDGFDDVIVGIPLFDTPTLKYAGRIEIYSGADGENLNSFNGTAAGQQFGSAIAVVADQNSDGIPDLIVGEPLFDVPATKSLKDAGRVALYSGSDGALLQVIATGSASGDHFGAAVAVGNGNLIVGSPWADLPLLKDAGFITVFNGISDTILYVRSGTQIRQYFGTALAFDEANDHLLVGSPGFDVLLPTKLTDAGRVDIFDGADGVSAALFSLEGSTKGNRFGSSVASFSADIGGTADVDWAVGSPGADLTDLVMLKPRKDIGMVQVFSGFDAVVQVQISGETAGDNFGAALAANGDFNNDSTPDLAIGAPGYDAPGIKVLKDAGTVEVFAGSELF